MMPAWGQRVVSIFQGERSTLMQVYIHNFGIIPLCEMKDIDLEEFLLVYLTSPSLITQSERDSSNSGREERNMAIYSYMEVTL